MDKGSFVDGIGGIGRYERGGRVKGKGLAVRGAGVKDMCGQGTSGKT